MSILRIPSLSLVGAIGFLALGTVPLAARPVEPATFGAIEVASTGDAALSAEQALAERLAPRGTPIAQASAALRRAGARVAPTAQGDPVRLVYTASQMEDDMSRLYLVTTTLSQKDGVVVSVSTARTAY